MVAGTLSHEQCGGEGTLGVGEGGAGGVTAGCSLYGVTLVRIPALSPVTMVGITVWWGRDEVACDGMGWDGWDGWDAWDGLGQDGVRWDGTGWDA